MAARDAHIAVMKYGVGTATPSTAIAKVISINPPALKRESIDTTCMGDSATTSRGDSCVDMGEYDVVLQYDPANIASHDWLKGVALDGSTNSYSLCPNGSTIEETWQAFVVEKSKDELSKGKNLQCTFKFRITGAATWADLTP